MGIAELTPAMMFARERENRCITANRGFVLGSSRWARAKPMLTSPKATVVAFAFVLVLVASGTLFLAQTPSARHAHPCEEGLEIEEMRCLVSQLSTEKGSNSCTTRAPHGWKTYVDRVHDFCLSYPSVYERRRWADMARKLFGQT